MKRLFRILILLIGTGIILLGLTTVDGWFTDPAESQLSVAVSGSLDVELSSGSLSATGITPGQDYIEIGQFCVRNSGTLDLKYRGLFESDQYGQIDFIQYMAMKVEYRSWDIWETLLEVSGSSEAGDQGLSTYFKFSDQPPGSVNRNIIQGNLAADQEGCYRLSVKLDPKIPDAFQNYDLDFVLHLYATQPENPGWED